MEIKKNYEINIQRQELDKRMLIENTPGQGRPTELPGGGMPRPSGDEDGDAGPFTTPACPGHRGHFVGRKPPPPTVPPMQHYVTPACTECKAPCHCTMRHGSGVKEAVASRGGG